MTKINKNDIAMIAIMLALCAILFALERLERMVFTALWFDEKPLDIPPLKRVVDSEVVGDDIINLHIEV